MTEASIAERWTRDEFLRAWAAGAFDRRVELVEGEVWPVVIGNWHGETVGQIVRLLPRDGFRISTATLPTGESLPDPDCWARRADAQPIAEVGARLFIWDPEDVALIVEVSDETVMHDLRIKAKLYGSAGYPVYWVVTGDAIYEHTDPTPGGYETKREFRPGELIPVHYADTALAVDDLLYPD
ncbi:Uma2 family endonuclease [Nocardia amikacinitolerans]|uniref:Uma2 family endonuclease n=1 Tax=Nocardia amikacinitolerans TaxID=756689 RepID=UPI0020A4F970|nr:Uma2 family endonuclease [Nocardia amikacinitolerans]MCP2287333.1 putative restriction endonuclease [Nocardia amikacinitolerans]